MTDDPEARSLRLALVRELTRSGSLSDPRWVTAFERVPRHVFVPSFLRTHNDGTYKRIEGTTPEQRREWLTAVYTDDSLITEFAGPFPVSSSSQPSLMAEMLETLEVTGTERILEIGTGTGYNTALLCEGLGAHKIVSVDIADDLVEAARGRLAALGYNPTLATTDGAAGYPDGALYHRIIATCSLPRVLPAWLEQVHPGGLILVSIYRELGGGAMARLRVENGHASGPFTAYFGGFMPTRAYERVRAVDLFDAHDEAAGDDGIRGSARIGAEALHDDAFAMFAALRVQAESLRLVPDTGPDEFWLLDRCGSWAYQTTDRDGGLVAVQGGPTRLWNALEAAHDDWTALGMPPREAFGLTVTSEGRHVVWYGKPGGPSWPL